MVPEIEVCTTDGNVEESGYLSVTVPLEFLKSKGTRNKLLFNPRLFAEELKIYIRTWFRST